MPLIAISQRKISGSSGGIGNQVTSSRDTGLFSPEYLLVGIIDEELT